MPGLSIVERVMILRSVDMFAEASDETLAGVAAILNEVDALEGEDIIRKGDLGTNMYIVVSGSVQVRDEGAVLATLGENGVFGELSALDPEPRSATVTALEDTLLLSLENRLLLELITEELGVAASVIRFLCDRIRASNVRERSLRAPTTADNRAPDL
jgi:CRP/FNR family transcriptional regulator, cyclic AMP receptor protein